MDTNTELLRLAVENFEQCTNLGLDDRLAVQVAVENHSVSEWDLIPELKRRRALAPRKALRTPEKKFRDALRGIVSGDVDRFLVDVACPMCEDALLEHQVREKDLLCSACPCAIRAGTAISVAMAQIAEGKRRPQWADAPREFDIPDDLFSPIVGLDDIKDLLLRSLRAERPVHQLLHGPPASAKTLFLLELERLGGGRYTLGSTSSRAGLRQLLMDERPRLLLIDELDKGRVSDYSVLLSAMENGILVDTHFNRHERVQSDVWVFAGANRIDGVWPELLSRFGDGIRIDPYTRPEFLEVAQRVLVDREGADEKTAEVIATAVHQRLQSKDVRWAIRVYRLAKSAEAVDGVIQTLQARR